MQENLNPPLPRRSNCCQIDQTPFNEEDEIFSLLDDEFNRVDYCKKCWEKESNKGKGFWRSIIPKKQIKVFTPDLKALELFKTYRTHEDLPSIKKRFILAIYLERKKQLACRKHDKKKNTLYFETLSSGEITSVEGVVIHPPEAEEILSQLVDHLES